jgi:uncharacterized HAD superfamily protein
MSDRRIYVDIDDVLAQTIARLLDLLEEIHGRRVDLQDITQFDLKQAFGLGENEIEFFMQRGHATDVIESILPMADAIDVLARWSEAGEHIILVTGRPPDTNRASKRWLEAHGVRHDALHHLDKWNRPSWNLEGLPAIGFADIPSFNFDFAVEDNLDTAVRLVEEFGVAVALMDRPWNRSLDSVAESTRSSLVRCLDWSQVETLFEANFGS